MSTKATIFIVDDSPDTVLGLQIYLGRAYRCDLKIARTGNEAIDILKNGERFDVIICDFMMDPGTGLDVLKFITDNGIQIPFIFYSGHATELQSYRSEICIAVVDKMKMDDLTVLVGQVIGQKAC